MSYENDVPTDCFYSYFSQSTALATFTTEDNLQKTFPPVLIRAGYILNLQDTGKSLRVKATGRLGTTGSPTFTWSMRLLTSTTWSAGGILLGSTAALTAGTTQTLAPWFLDVEIGLKTLSIGGASTLRTMGEVRSPLGLASPFSGSIPANNTSPDVATFDNSVQYYLFISAACGTSNAANLIQTESLKVYGDN
jgi:hypothetical protein